MLAACARRIAGVGFSRAGILRRGLAMKRSPPRWRGTEPSCDSNLRAAAVSGVKPLAVDMRLVLADQPFLRIPGTVGAPSGDAFDAATATDVLVSKEDELGARAHLDVEEAAAAARARLNATSFGAASVLRRLRDLGMARLPIALKDKAQREHKFRNLALI